MAEEIGKIGSSTNKLLIKRKIFRFLFLFFLALFIFIIILMIYVFYPYMPLIFKYFYFMPLKHKIYLVAIELTLLIGIFFSLYNIFDLYEDINKLKKKISWAEKGLEAEYKVANILKSLDDNYIVFHDIYTGRGNIDHLVIYKPKNLVFLLETKASRDIPQKNIRKWYRDVFKYMDWLEKSLKKKKIFKDKDYQIIPIIVLPFSKRYLPNTKIRIINGENLIKEIIRYSKVYKSYKTRKNIDWVKLIKIIQKENIFIKKLSKLLKLKSN